MPSVKKLYIVINTDNHRAIQRVAELLSEYEIDSMGWSPPRPNEPVYREVPKGAGGQGFVEAARGVSTDREK